MAANPTIRITRCMGVDHEWCECVISERSGGREVGIVAEH